MKKALCGAEESQISIKSAKSQTTMTKPQSNPNSINHKQKYDLEERTLEFSKDLIDFAKRLPQNSITKSSIIQLIRCGTSIGANCSEADEASSRKDFINKITIAKKEARETKYWLRIIVHTLPQFKDEARKLYKEAQELNLILAAIVHNSKKNEKTKK